MIDITAMLFCNGGIMIDQYDNESDFKVMRKKDAITIITYLGSKTEVRIPPRIQNLPVTSIWENAFRDRKSLTAITIPDGVTSIGSAAFCGCTRLVTIAIPNSVTII